MASPTGPARSSRCGTRPGTPPVSVSVVTSPTLAADALRRVAASGVTSWGADLLYGLPPEVDPDPMVSLEVLLRAGTPHLSLYELVPEPGTELGFMVARMVGELTPGWPGTGCRG